jgi:hypothetical protein
MDSDPSSGSLSLSSRGEKLESGVLGSCERYFSLSESVNPDPPEYLAPAARSPRLAPAPVHPRPRCQSPLALTGSRPSRLGAGLMQSARYLGRSYITSLAPARRNQNQPARVSQAAPHLQRSSGRTQVPRGGEARPALQNWQSARHLGSPGCPHVSTPCALDPANAPGGPR